MNKSSIQKLRKRGDNDYSLDLKRYDNRMNETNPAADSFFVNQPHNLLSPSS